MVDPARRRLARCSPSRPASASASARVPQRCLFLAGHISDALSVPIDELEAVLARLLKRRQGVAYCRGPYCVLAPQAVERLRRHGFNARRLEDGMPEWRSAGLPVALGDQA